jgi:hypothetical protein
MARENERPKSERVPLERGLDSDPEQNQAQRNSDAPPDAVAELAGDVTESSDRGGSRGSDANGIPAFDDVQGESRKKLYRDGATLVSRID